MSDFQTLRGLLEFHIKNLHLKPNAPYPREQLDMRQMIKEWRAEQRCKLVEKNDGRKSTS